MKSCEPEAEYEPCEHNFFGFGAFNGDRDSPSAPKARALVSGSGCEDVVVLVDVRNAEVLSCEIQHDKGGFGAQ